MSTQQQDDADRVQEWAGESERDMSDFIDENMDLLQEYHIAQVYTGIKDNWEPAFDRWLCDLTEADIIKILYNKEKE